MKFTSKLLGIFLLIFCDTITSKTTAKLTRDEETSLTTFHRLIDSEIKDLASYMRSDVYLIRWLKSNNFDTNTAVMKLRQALKWRKENNMDLILNEIPPKDIARNAMFFIDGIDRTGSPVLSADWSHLDIRRLLVTGKRNDILRYFVRMWELAEVKVEEVRNTTGNDVSQIVAIFDIQGYNLRQHACVTCFGVFLEYLRYVTNYYPGLIKDLYLINAPRSFQRFTELFKPALPEARRNIFKVYGFDKNEWVPLVLQNIQPEQLRPQFGGTKVSN